MFVLVRRGRPARVTMSRATVVSLKMNRGR